mgnify:CR=1 FL=1
MAYNIGDKVTIKESLDPGCSTYDYQCTLTGDMLKKFGGKTFSIVDKREFKPDFCYKYPSDGFIYVLNIPDPYNWTIGMFKSSENKAVIKIKKRPIKLNYSL